MLEFWGRHADPQILTIRYFHSFGKGNSQNCQLLEFGGRHADPQILTIPHFHSSGKENNQNMQLLEFGGRHDPQILTIRYSHSFWEGKQPE